MKTSGVFSNVGADYQYFMPYHKALQEMSDKLTEAVAASREKVIRDLVASLGISVDELETAINETPNAGRTKFLKKFLAERGYGIDMELLVDGGTLVNGIERFKVWKLVKEVEFSADVKYTTAGDNINVDVVTNLKVIHDEMKKADS